MAKKKEAPKCYQLKNNMVIMEQKDIVNLTEEDRSIIEFHVNVLKFQMVFVEPEVKVRKTFKIENAYKYIAKKDKESIAEFDALKEAANEAVAKYKALCDAYKNKYGKEADKDNKAAAAETEPGTEVVAAEPVETTETEPADADKEAKPAIDLGIDVDKATEEEFIKAIKAAKKAMIKEQKNAFIEQKNLFRKKFGEEGYEAVKNMK